MTNDIALVEDDMTTFTTRKAPAVDQRTSYLAGWNASKRSTTGDLEAAEGRFIAKYGSTTHDEFIKGWTDHAADNEKWHSLPEFHPVFAASQLAYEDPEEAELLWADGFRPVEAQCVRTHDEVVYRRTDLFGVRTVGKPMVGYVVRVLHRVWDDELGTEVGEVVLTHCPSDLQRAGYDVADFSDSTEGDACDEVWSRRSAYAPTDLPGTVEVEVLQ